MPPVLAHARPALRPLSRLRPSGPFSLPPPRHPSRALQTAVPGSASTSTTPDYAFAFDIDGVLLHGRTPHPRARTALSLLHKHNLEYLLLTNGGGTSEAARVAELSSLLQTPLHTSQFVQSHTPFRTLADPAQTVLVIGGKEQSCRSVAESYGWKRGNVLIPADFVVRDPALAPMADPERYRHLALPGAEGHSAEGGRGVASSKLGKVDAVFVYNDPRDWALDIQLIIDVLLSRNGDVSTRRSIAEVIKDGHVPVYFSNPDLWWANEYAHPRLGQGGFRAALEGVWRAVTGGEELCATAIGKPHTATYKYAEDVLTAWRRERLKERGLLKEEQGEGGGNGRLRRVYMVGDNPLSDIAGANSFRSERGTEWVSVLVRSGVWRDGDDTNGAKMVVDDVEAAVRLAIERETGGR